MVVEDKSKTSYTQNLENYSKQDKTMKKEAPKLAKKKSSEPEKLAKDPDAGVLGNAIDALLDDEPMEESKTPINKPKEIGENAEIVDDIGMAIDDALKDL